VYWDECDGGEEGGVEEGCCVGEVVMRFL
jgi:hypothetical protein